MDELQLAERLKAARLNCAVTQEQLLFPKLGKRRTWFMVKKDLERIGIPYENADGIADFHAAGRHTHITELLRNGATLPEPKELARHSDIKMTMRYTHIGIEDQAKAVRQLPWHAPVESPNGQEESPPAKTTTSQPTTAGSVLGVPQVSQPVTMGHLVTLHASCHQMTQALLMTGLASLFVF